MHELVDEAIRGRDIWLGVKELYGWNDGMTLVILPDADERIDINKMLNCLKKYMKHNYVCKAIVVLDRCYLFENESNSTIEFIYFDSAQIQQLIRYYRLVQFAEDIRVISTDLPFGSGGLIGKEMITLEDYMMDAIFS